MTERDLAETAGILLLVVACLWGEGVQCGCTPRAFCERVSVASTILNVSARGLG